MKFVRVLYGSNFEETRPKILRDLKRSFARNPEFCRDAVWYTMGNEATKLLKTYGANDIRQVTGEPLLADTLGTKSWNKMYLLQLALKGLGEDILYTDMDTFPRPGTTKQQIEDLIVSKVGLSRIFQMTLISYHKNYFWFRQNNKGKGWDKISPKLGLFGCFIYLNSIELTEWFLEDCKELEQCYDVRPVSDERFVTYSIDKRFGPLNARELWQHVVPATALINPRCRLLKDSISKYPNPIFKHMR